MVTPPWRRCLPCGRCGWCCSLFCKWQGSQGRPDQKDTVTHTQLGNNSARDCLLVLKFITYFLNQKIYTNTLVTLKTWAK